MVVGLGTGSTAYFAVERLGMLIKSGALTDIVAIPTSERTREQAGRAQPHYFSTTMCVKPLSDWVTLSAKSSKWTALMSRAGRLSTLSR